MLKQKIKNGKKTIGMHVNLSDITIGRMAGLAGYDFIWVDFEHSYMNFESLLGQIIAIQAGGTPVIVRVPQNDLTSTKKIIEMGPDGIIFPMVHNAAEAEALLDMTLYPPYGNRGFGPMNAIGYGFSDAKQFVTSNHRDMCRFIQIEHREAVEDLDNIAKLDFIDGYIFGPNDLSGSVGQLLDVFEPDTTELIKRAVATLRKHGKYIGLSTGDISESTIRHWHDMDVDMLSVGADYDFVRMLMQQNLQTLNRLHKGIQE